MTDATKQKRLECAAALVRRFRVHNTLLPNRTKCPNYLTTDQWTPISLGLVMPWLGYIGIYHKHYPELKTIVELLETLQIIWDSLPRGPIDKAVKKFQK